MNILRIHRQWQSDKNAIVDLYHKEDFQGAIALSKTALRRFPLHRSFLALIITSCYFQLADLDGILADYRAFIHDPRCKHSVFQQLCILFALNGRVREFEETFEKYLTIRPNNNSLTTIIVQLDRAGMENVWVSALDTFSKYRDCYYLPIMTLISICIHQRELELPLKFLSKHLMVSRRAVFAFEYVWVARMCRHRIHWSVVELISRQCRGRDHMIVQELMRVGKSIERNRITNSRLTFLDSFIQICFNSSHVPALESMPSKLETIAWSRQLSDLLFFSIQVASASEELEGFSLNKSLHGDITGVVTGRWRNQLLQPSQIIKHKE